MLAWQRLIGRIAFVFSGLSGQHRPVQSIAGVDGWIRWRFHAKTLRAQKAALLRAWDRSGGTPKNQDWPPSWPQKDQLERIFSHIVVDD